MGSQHEEFILISFPMRRIRKWFLLAATLIFGTVCFFEAQSWYRANKAHRLCEAVHYGDEERIRRLLEVGVSPDWKTSYGLSARELAEQEDCEWCEAVFADFGETSVESLE